MIRWGIIGTGGIANQFAKDFSGVKSGELKKVYGRNKEKSESFAKKYGMTYETNLDDFLKDENIDVVYIGLPHSLHAEISSKALNENKAVLCEKPFSYNYKTTKAVLELAKEKDLFIMEALWTLYLPAVQKAMAWIEAGEIGRVRHLEANFGFNGGDDENGRLLNPDLAGGSLLDVGIYPLILGQLISGDGPQKIYAEAQMTKTGVDGHLSMLLRYKNDITANFSSSVTLDTSQTATIYGEKGKIVMPNFFMTKVVELHINGEVRTYQADYDEVGYHFEAEAVSRLLQEKKKQSPLASYEFTEKLSKTMDKIRKLINLKYPFE